LSKPRVGMIGVGRFGQNHSRILAAAPWCDYQGLFDINLERAEEIARRDTCPKYNSASALLDHCDAVVIAVSTANHFDIVREALTYNVRVLIEKPLTDTIETARKLTEIADQNMSPLFVGHLERFNPAIIRAFELIPQPETINIERLGTWQPRPVSADVIMDLMIHDLDMLLHHGQRPVSESFLVSASAVVSEFLDHCTCALTLENGGMATITSNRVADRRHRQLRLTAGRRQVVADLMTQNCVLYEPDGGDVIPVKEEITTVMPLDLELEAFVTGNCSLPEAKIATYHDGVAAMEFAQAILNAIQR